MSDSLELKSILLATEIMNSVSSGPPAQTMNNATESRFSPDATPFQPKMHSELFNNGEQRTGAQEGLTSSGRCGLDSDCPRKTFNEPPDGQSSVEKKSDVESAADRKVDSDDSHRFVLNVDLVEKCISTASSYLSLLTREQLDVLRSIRPEVLYAFLVEATKVWSDKQTRYVFDECKFCKNNGESEELYQSHILKDSRGRVLCPVLRAFRCPRCSATGDRAHTIKYCPQRFDDRHGYYRRHRPQTPPSFTLGFGKMGDDRHFTTSSVSEESTSLASENPEDWFRSLGIN